MYLWVPCPPDMTAADFAFYVLQNTGVVVTPGSAFGEGGEGFVRVSLIAEEDRLKEALQRLKNAGIRYPTSVTAPQDTIRGMTYWSFAALSD